MIPLERKKTMRKTIKTIIAAALIAVMLCSSAMAASYGAKVLSTSMGVYNAGKQMIGSLDQGTSIKVTAVSGSWARISYRGATGYAKLKDIIFNKRVKAVSTQDTAIRFVTRASYGDNTYYKATLAANTGVYVVGKRGSYALISNAEGNALGYVKASALRKY